MNGVMRMKKTLIMVAVLLLILGGLFFWKGGHHALFLADRLEDWLDSDAGAATLTLDYQPPEFEVDPETGRLTPLSGQFSLSAEGGWCEFDDDTLYSLTMGPVSAYVLDDVVCLDSGRAYTLPDLSTLSGSAGDLRTGLLLYGRVTKDGDTYTVSMDTKELELTVKITADKTITSVTGSALLSDGTQITGSVVPHEPMSAAIPDAVSDALLRSKTEPPVAVTELLDVVLPAMENLMPLSGELTLGVECGILEVSETADFRLSGNKAELERSGIIVTIDLPRELEGADPTALALLLLRNGEFSQENGVSSFRIVLPSETTNELCASLVPQIRELGMDFSESQALLTFSEGALRTVSMNAEGSVPFLFSPLPVSFRAELNIP